jgi:hydrogenase expression/formation protein HypE
MDPRASLSASAVRPDDRILVTGHIGDHGITVLLARGDIDLDAGLRSDTRSVYPFADALLEAAGSKVRWMRDPTRGGLATSLNELARDCGLGVVMDEESVPVRDEVRGACELLGLDPLYVANEGKLIAIVAPEAAREILDAMRGHARGLEAAIIGTVGEESPGLVTMRTAFGSTRIVDVLPGEQLPRIC